LGAQSLDAAGQGIATLVELKSRRMLDRRLSEALQHFLGEADTAALAFLDEVQHLEVGDTATPGGEIVRRVEFVELVPHDEARFLEHVIGIGAVGEQGQDVGIEAALGLQEQAEEQAALRWPRIPLNGVLFADHERLETIRRSAVPGSLTTGS